MPASLDQYMNPQPGGIGPGTLLGLGAQASAYDYFLLRGRAFSRVATEGVPQGIFGLRGVGGRLLRAASRNYGPGAQRIMAPLRPAIGRTGAFLRGTGAQFGRFAGPRGPWMGGPGSLLTESTATAIRGRVQALPLIESFRGMRSPEVRGILEGVRTRAGGRLAAGEAALVGRGISRAAIFSGVGRIAGGVLPVVNALLLGKLAVDIAGAAGMAMGRTLGAVTATVPQMVAGIRETEFGGPLDAFQYSAAITERQRALAAIQGSSMNARTFFGNEAQLYSDSY